jgi:hypothetical protein
MPPTLARLLSAAFGVLLLVTVTAATPHPAVASCVGPVALVDSLQAADVVIVGTVVATANQDRMATVSLEEVWKGPALPALLTVDGGPGGGAIASSVDRSFERGIRYLFVLSGGDQGIFHDNACSATTPWEDAFAALRPADAPTQAVEKTENPNAFDISGVVGPALVAVIVALALLGTGLLARGRQQG